MTDQAAPASNCIASVYIATSLDGFIARPNGDIDWLGEPSQDDEDYGYQQFIDSVDCLVMGRNTFEKVLTFGDWPYSKPVVVLSHRALNIPAEIEQHVECMSGSPLEIVRRLTKTGATNLYIDGGKTVQDFLSAGLIQRIIITRIPILLGEGIPLFGSLRQDVRLTHFETHTFPNGIVQSEYAIDKQP